MVEINGAKKYQKISIKDKFKFSCHKGLACFGQCCSNVNIFLTPYDVLRMRKASGLPSGEFLEKYTITLLGEQKIPVVMLKMNDDELKTCPFIKSDGCSIYQDRPWSCRMFPVGTNVKTADQTGSEEFCLMAEKGSTCLGVKEEKEWTVTEWFKDQGIDLYNKKGKLYQAITLHKAFHKGQSLTEPKARAFYIAFYDLDRFRRLLFESSFFKRFDIENKVIEKIKVDDEALLKFGAKWLRFSLFGGKTLQIKEEMLDRDKRNKIQN